MAKRPTRMLRPIGWREWVLLPEICPVAMKAKIDTGARTSSLHAFDLEVEGEGDEARATFEVHPLQRSAQPAITVSHPVAGFRTVRSSSGHAEVRPVIRTPLLIGDDRYEIDLTLTARDAMGFRMLLWRAAIRRRFTVDAGRSFLHRSFPRNGKGPPS